MTCCFRPQDFNPRIHISDSDFVGFTQACDPCITSRQPVSFYLSTEQYIELASTENLFCREQNGALCDLDGQVRSDG